MLHLLRLGDDETTLIAVCVVVVGGSVGEVGLLRRHMAEVMPKREGRNRG